MSYENFVRVKLVTPVAIDATSFAIVDAVAPNKLPPIDGGYLVLCDSPGNPTYLEVIQYTSRSGLGISGVTRGVEGTSARAWTGNIYAFQALMAGEANLIQTTLAGKEPAIAVGTTAKYWRGDKSFVDFFTDVRVTTLTGLSTATNAVITATDTVLSSLGKLQKQVSDAASNLATNVRAVVLTGYVSGTNTALAATDTVLEAFAKVQGQLTARVVQDTSTGAAQLPAGTTAQRPASGAGKLRFNSNLGRPEVNNGTAWGSLGGATGGGNDAVFYCNDQTISTDFTVIATQNAMSAGPISIATGVTVTVATGATWSIV